MVNYFSVKTNQIIEELSFRRRFSDKTFRKIDKTLWWNYLGANPYRACRKHMQKRGEVNIHQYGETPLLTMDRIAKLANLQEDDHLYELGCGRGRTCFFLNHFYGCKVTGVDWVEEFVKKGKLISREHQLNVNFLQSDFLDVDLGDATIVYLYGTCLSDEMIFRLCSQIPKGVRVVSVSYPLSDYSSRFTIESEIRAKFPWGSTEVYLNK